MAIRGQIKSVIRTEEWHSYELLSNSLFGDIPIEESVSVWGEIKLTGDSIKSHSNISCSQKIFLTTAADRRPANRKASVTGSDLDMELGSLSRSMYRKQSILTGNSVVSYITARRWRQRLSDDEPTGYVTVGFRDSESYLYYPVTNDG